MYYSIFAIKSGAAAAPGPPAPPPMMAVTSKQHS